MIWMSMEFWQMCLWDMNAPDGSKVKKSYLPWHHSIGLSSTQYEVSNGSKFDNKQDKNTQVPLYLILRIKGLLDCLYTECHFESIYGY